MPIPVMRDGRLVGNPLDGADLTKLKSQDKSALLEVLTKADAGKSLSLDDLNVVMASRRKTGVKPPPADSSAPSLSDTLAKMKEVFGNGR